MQSEQIVQHFDDEYIERQIRIMNSMIEESPASAIGKAKELVESCFKHILDKENIRFGNSPKFGELRKQVFSLLNLDVSENEHAQSNKEVIKILNSFKQIIDGINALRNDKGDGHGKGEGFIELPARYAYLVVGSAITIVDFIWRTYQFKYSS